MINKHKKWLWTLFLIPVLFLGVTLYLEIKNQPILGLTNWNLILMISTCIMLVLLILLKARIYFSQVSKIFNWIFLSGSIIASGYAIIGNQPEFLIYLFMLFAYYLFDSLFIERTTIEHFEYQVKHKLKDNYSDQRFDGLEHLSKNTYLRAFKRINFFIILLGIIGGILFVLTGIKGLEAISETDTFSDGLGLLGVAFGLIGFLGILITMENNRENSKAIVKNYHFILGKTNKEKRKASKRKPEEKPEEKSEFENKLINTDSNIIAARDLDYLFDLVLREDEKNKMIIQIEELVSSEKEDGKPTEEDSQESSSFLGILVRFFKLLSSK